jgi:4-alpha-glucanotransferase
MNLSRSNGVLLHPTSLPGRFGIGDLGDEAYRFADFLGARGQNSPQRRREHRVDAESKSNQDARDALILDRMTFMP